MGPYKFQTKLIISVLMKSNAEDDVKDRRFQSIPINVVVVRGRPTSIDGGHIESFASNL